MNVFQFNGYREILREALLAKKRDHGRSFTFAKMAAACRVRHTYLSTVLKGEGDLNADQVFDAAQFVGLSDEEYQYLSLVHEYERSVSAARRQRLGKDIAVARERGLRTENFVDAKPLPGADTSAIQELYLNPNAQLVHMFMTVRRYQDDPERARRALGLEQSVFNEAMTACERAGLLRRSGKKVEVIKDSIHLPASSPFYSTYRSALRLKAMEFMQSRASSRHYSFGVLYSASDDTRRKIQSRFLEFIDWAQQLTQGTAPTDVYQLNFDLLRWSQD